MSSPISPIVSGLLSATHLADIFKRHQQQNEYLSLAKQRQQQDAERQQFAEQMQNAQFDSHMLDVGARVANGGDMAEAQSGMRIDPATPAGPGMLYSTAPSDLGSRLVKGPGGRQWVMPSTEERETRLDTASARATKRKVDETAAVGDAKTKSAIAAKQAELDNFGIPFDDETAKTLGVKPGTKYRAENIDDIARAVATITRTRGLMDPKNPEHTAIQHAFLTNADGRQTIAAVRKNGELLSFDLGASPERKLSPMQAAKAQKDAQTTAIDGFANQVFSTLNGKLDNPEKVQSTIAALSKDNPFVAQNQLRIYERLRGKGAAARKPTVNAGEADILKQFGLTGEAQGGKNGAGVALKKTDAETVRAFAAKNKVTYEQALKKAEADGYQVEGK